MIHKRYQPLNSLHSQLTDTSNLLRSVFVYLVYWNIDILIFIACRIGQLGQLS